MKQDMHMNQLVHAIAMAVIVIMSFRPEGPVVGSQG
jgi:hypothetical protein